MMDMSSKAKETTITNMKALPVSAQTEHAGRGAGSMSSEVEYAKHYGEVKSYDKVIIELHELIITGLIFWNVLLKQTSM